MFSYFKKPDFSSGFFVASSLSAFVIVGIFYLYLGLVTSFVAKTDDLGDTYYLKSDFAPSDPLLTRQPSLKDIFAGPIISSLDPSIGPAKAPVVIVEFSDFNCNYCRNQEAVIKNILSAYKEKVKLLWKDYPDNDVKSLSYQAAIAARCAHEQNKFWLFHDDLFEAEIKDSSIFIQIAKKLKLNEAEFNNCLQSSRGRQFVNDNIKEANALEITGVPFIYVNDQEIMGEATYDELERVVKIELNRASKGTK